jgi:hypothetical protein
MHVWRCYNETSYFAKLIYARKKKEINFTDMLLHKALKAIMEKINLGI